MLDLIEKARRDGLKITADMYLYPAAGTGLNACLPPWALDGGYEVLFKRLQDPAMRKKIAEAVRAPTTDWENFISLRARPIVSWSPALRVKN